MNKLTDTLNQEILTEYLIKHIAPISSLKIEQFSGGASNLTYVLKTDLENYILRTAPKGTKAKGAHNMNREYNILKLLHPQFKLCPEVLHFCDDSSIVGGDFYLMKQIDGTIIRSSLPDIYKQDDCVSLCENLIQVFHKLHKVNSTALKKFNKGRGYIERQISGWSKRYVNARTDDVPNGETVMRWLKKHQPKDIQAYCLIHNDYKFDNVVFAKENKHKIIGVLDWEMATIGDPLMDLGCSLAYWIQADDPTPLQKISMMPSNHPGMLSRDELVEHYCKHSHFQLDNYHYYYVFGLFRLAVIVQQIYYRYKQGMSKNPKFASFGQICQIMIRQAESQINTH
ncbi:MAG: phosphotransferase family protein [Proteobacteria bacterium]|nr:phosphotransferase family protein [Pseudomonadota bacterium]